MLGNKTDVVDFIKQMTFSSAAFLSQILAIVAPSGSVLVLLSSYEDVIAYVASMVVAFLVYCLLFLPLNRTRTAMEIGWNHLNKGSRGSGNDLAQRIKDLQRLRKKGDLPPVYPNGWFALIESRFLKKKQVISVHALGQAFAVFRDDSGKSHVLDAYCPHLGADMTVGGQVKGQCLECPFHGWQFNGKDGSCTHIPNSVKVPPIAKVRHWPSKEVNGFVFAWHDSEGREPMWQVPDIPEVENGTWHYRGCTNHEVFAHIQEIPENGADLAHLAHIHVPIIFKGPDLAKAFTPNKIGPGLVHLKFETLFGPGIFIQAVTPLEPLKQSIIHHLYTSNTLIAPVAKLIMMAESYHVERDIMIWNSKQFLQHPMLVSDDELIAKFRRWYRQFYSENSPRIENFRQSLEW